MIQTTFIQEWCAKKGFNFHNCDVSGEKLPCALDKKWDGDEMGIYISGFYDGSKKIGISYGGLQSISTLRVSINELPDDFLEKKFLPTKYVCDKCGNKNLNLRTEDNHKTYICGKCRGDKPKAKQTDLNTAFQNKENEVSKNE